MILFPAVVQAKTYTDAAKCAIIVHNKSVAPANPPKWVTGTGIGKPKHWLVGLQKRMQRVKLREVLMLAIVIVVKKYKELLNAHQV